jgi:outer membrane protein OmpA-like peptidoglycan-associated protein/osmotically-inducible protein OsmY
VAFIVRSQKDLWQRLDFSRRFMALSGQAELWGPIKMSLTTRWIIAALLFFFLSVLAIYANFADLTGFRGAHLIESHVQNKAETVLKETDISEAANVMARAEGQRVVLTGVVPNETAGQAVIGEVRRAIGPGGVAIGGVTVVGDDLTISNIQTPYTLDVSHGEGAVVLSGFVPSQEAKASIDARARTLFPSSRTDNQLQIAQGAPGDVDWLSSANWGLERLARLDEGRLSLQDRALTLRGRSGLEAVAGDIAADFNNNAPQNFVAEAAITLSPASIIPEDAAPADLAEPAASSVAAIDNRDQCQSLFNNLMANNEIRFAFNSADIEPASIPLLEQLAAAARQCERFAIKVEGHTDSVGASEVNQMLSELRASNVVDLIAARGVGAGRLTSAGFGDTAPIATNQTREGRARNRRIVFVISE